MAVVINLSSVLLVGSVDFTHKLAIPSGKSRYCRYEKSGFPGNALDSWWVFHIYRRSHIAGKAIILCRWFSYFKCLSLVVLSQVSPASCFAQGQSIGGATAGDMRVTVWFDYPINSGVTSGTHMYMYIYLYIYVHTYIHTYIQTNIHTYIHRYIDT